MYIDGVSLPVTVSSSAPATPTINVDDVNFRIGDSTVYGSILPFTGRIQDVRVYNRGLSSSEVLATYVGDDGLYSPAIGIHERYYRANAPIGAIGTGLHAIEAGGVYGAPGINSGLHAIDTGVVTL